EDAPAMGGDQSIENHAVGLQAAQRADFVQPHKPAVLGNICRENRGQLAFDHLDFCHRLSSRGANAEPERSIMKYTMYSRFVRWWRHNCRSLGREPSMGYGRSMAGECDGYAADIPYLRDFKPMLAPAWLDHVALVCGVAPPARKDGFTWCDLGCGQGVTAAILAATHPSGLFHGIDAMPVHINHARRLAVAAAIPNLQFHAVDFAAAMDLELPQFDYIVAHGVYTWVNREAQNALRRFCERRLKPGGLVYLGYNTMPGWACDLP